MTHMAGARGPERAMFWKSGNVSIMQAGIRIRGFPRSWFWEPWITDEALVVGWA